MPTSEARIQANRRNAQLSTGPKSAEGKEQSRRNALKHGLAGEGIVLPATDAAEVARRNVELLAQFAPKTAMGEILVLKLATLSVKMERSARHEAAAIAKGVRHAVDDFDDARLDEADRLLDSIGDDPRKALRRLRRSPEGVEALLDAWNELRDDLARGASPTWTARHIERMGHLTGRKVGDLGSGRPGDLSQALDGDFSGLGADDGAGLDSPQRREWARCQLLGRIDAEVAGLEAHYETLDFAALELDRAEAPGRALFDDSKGATLARRYESAASRDFFKAMKELRRVEAEAEAAEVAAEPPRPEAAALASSGAGPIRAPRDPRPAPSMPRFGVDEADFGANGRVGIAVEGRRAPEPAGCR